MNSFQSILKIGALVVGGFLILTALLADVVLDVDPRFGFKQYLLLFSGVLIALFGLLTPQWQQRIALVISSVVISILLFELVLRLFLGPYFSITYEYDSNLLFKLAPNLKKYTRQLPENGTGRNRRILLSINSDGYRGPELPRSGQRRRLVVYGDSFILATATEYDQTLPAQLQARLHAAGQTDLDVINAGVSAYGLDQTYLRMKRDLHDLAPELVVLAVYSGNDFGDSIRNKLFYLDDEGNMQRNHQIDTSPLQATIISTYRKPYLIRALDLSIRRLGKQRLESRPRSGPYDRPEAWLRSTQREYYRYVVDGDNRVTQSVLWDYYDADVAMARDSESAQYKIRLMQQLLSAVKSLCDGYGVPLVILIIPHPIDAITDYDMGLVDTEKHPGYTRTGLGDIVQSTAAALDVPNINLIELFGGSNVGEYYLKGGDPHWNDRGQALAAEKLAQLISLHRLAGETPPSSAPLGPGVGDVARRRVDDTAQ